MNKIFVTYTKIENAFQEGELQLKKSQWLLFIMDFNLHHYLATKIQLNEMETIWDKKEKFFFKTDIENIFENIFEDNSEIDNVTG